MTRSRRPAAPSCRDRAGATPSARPPSSPTSHSLPNGPGSRICGAGEPRRPGGGPEGSRRGVATGAVSYSCPAAPGLGRRRTGGQVRGAEQPRENRAK
ncbi:exported hypothetical protein [Streptomyces murinus]